MHPLPFEAHGLTQELSTIAASLQRSTVQIRGWLILAVAANSPAAVGGLIPGDTLIGSNTRWFTDWNGLDDRLEDIDPGEQLSLDVLQSGRHTVSSVRVGCRSNRTETA